MEGAPKNAIDLLGKMLVLDPRKRITPKEVKIDFLCYILIYQRL